MSKVETNRRVILTLRTTEKEYKLINSYIEDSIHKDRSKAIRSALFDHIQDFYSIPNEILD